MNQNILGNIARTLGLGTGMAPSTLSPALPQAGTLSAHSYYDIFTHPPQQHVFTTDYRMKHTAEEKQLQLQQYFGADTLPVQSISTQLSTFADEPLTAIRLIIDKAVDRIFRNDPACSVHAAYTGTELSCQSSNIALHDNRQKLAGMLHQLIVQAQQQGSIAARKDATLLARYIVSAIGGFWQSYLLSGDKAAIRDMADLLMDSLAD